MCYLGDCKFYKGEIVNYKPRETETTYKKEYKVTKILPQEDYEYYDKDETENYWIQNINNPKEIYLVFPWELSKA